jgi:hypothetical protein
MDNHKPQTDLSVTDLSVEMGDDELLKPQAVDEHISDRRYKMIQKRQM